MIPGRIAPVGSLSEKVDELMVDWFICWLKVADTVAFRSTPVAPSAGTIETTATTGSEVPEPLPHPVTVASNKAAPNNHKFFLRALYICTEACVSRT